MLDINLCFSFKVVNMVLCVNYLIFRIFGININKLKLNLFYEVYRLFVC